MAPEFSLQSVLNYRRNLVEKLELELSQLMAETMNIQLVIQNLNQVRGELLESMQRMQQGELDLFEVQARSQNLKWLDNQLDRFHAQRLQAEQKVEAKRQEMVQARQDEEVLQILKNKEIATYQAALLQIENRMQDDAYIARAHRSQSHIYQ